MPQFKGKRVVINDRPRLDRGVLQSVAWGGDTTGMIPVDLRSSFHYDVLWSGNDNSEHAMEHDIGSLLPVKAKLNDSHVF